MTKIWNKGIKIDPIKYPNMFKPRHAYSDEFRKKSSESHKGQVAWNKGKKMSKEYVEKNRLAHIGIKHSEEARLRKSINWIEDRTKLKMSDRMIGDSRARDWSKEVKKRDGWICRIADINCDGKLESHHILPWSKFPELRYQINNGITLCHAHHPRKQNDVQKLSPYFQRLVASLD
jgi:hypothetical protein